MKEYPIIFRADMVKAILEGRKTQTRRIIQPQPDSDGGWKGCVSIGDHNIAEFCPLGQAGDRLRVKETWAVHEVYDEQTIKELPIGAVIYYKANGVQVEDAKKANILGRWRSSRFMPRWASRINLENVIDPYPQRVQLITEEGAIAEGIRRIFIQGVPWFYITESGGPSFEQGREAYAALWDSIHGVGAWIRNDWVWVDGFKRI